MHGCACRPRQHPWSKRQMVAAETGDLNVRIGSFASVWPDHGDFRSTPDSVAKVPTLIVLQKSQNAGGLVFR
jgi:hypothetical protein